MENFLDDFNIFLNMIFNSIKNLWNWLASTILGEIMIFMLIIGLFIGIIYLFIEMRK